VLGGGDEIVDFTEVDLTDDFGLAIEALAIAGVVIPDLCTAAGVLAKGIETQPFGDPVIIG
jgi:hypothetical protein